MATRQQIERLALRIEQVASRSAKRSARLEQWTIDRGMARCHATAEEIPEAELEARPCAGRRIVHVIVDPPARAGIGQTPAGQVA